MSRQVCSPKGARFPLTLFFQFLGVRPMLFTLLTRFYFLQICRGLKEAALGDDLSHGSHLFP